MAATANGEGGPARQLILTVTRACNLRCSYCPTVKDGFPSLTPEDAVRAVDLFVDRYGGGELKLFGGEPLLVPDVVAAVLDATDGRDGVRRVQLSTNGLGLDAAWLERLAAHSSAVLQISIDGDEAVHQRFRRSLPGVPDTYAHLMTLRDALIRQPRLIVTQTIAPAAADRAASSFDHLAGLGFRRFNLLPGYYLAWSEEQLDALRRGFAAIGDRFEAAWEADAYLYLRNLFTLAPTPFFNTGLVVDSDGTIHPSNVGLSGQLDGLRGRTQVGTLDEPPNADALDEAGRRVGALIEDALPPRILESTRAVDAVLTALVRRLLPSWAAWRKRRRGAA